jgi:hypothetical protein
LLQSPRWQAETVPLNHAARASKFNLQIYELGYKNTSMKSSQLSTSEIETDLRTAAQERSFVCLFFLHVKVGVTMDNCCE